MALLACKGNDNSKRLVSETSAEERMAICKAHKAELRSSIVGGCVLEGIGLESKQACLDQRDKCLAEPANGPINCDMAFHNLDNCNATVAEFENCLPQLVDWLKTVSCDDYDKRVPFPPVCSLALNQTCPTQVATDAGVTPSGDASAAGDDGGS